MSAISSLTTSLLDISSSSSTTSTSSRSTSQGCLVTSWSRIRQVEVTVLSDKSDLKESDRSKTFGISKNMTLRLFTHNLYSEWGNSFHQPFHELDSNIYVEGQGFLVHAKHSQPYVPISYGRPHLDLIPYMKITLTKDSKVYYIPSYRLQSLRSDAEPLRGAVPALRSQILLMYPEFIRSHIYEYETSGNTSVCEMILYIQEAVKQMIIHSADANERMRLTRILCQRHSRFGAISLGSDPCPIPPARMIEFKNSKNKLINIAGTVQSSLIAPLLDLKSLFRLRAICKDVFCNRTFFHFDLIQKNPWELIFTILQNRKGYIDRRQKAINYKFTSKSAREEPQLMRDMIENIGEAIKQAKSIGNWKNIHDSLLLLKNYAEKLRKRDTYYISSKDLSCCKQIYDDSLKIVLTDDDQVHYKNLCLELYPTIDQDDSWLTVFNIFKEATQKDSFNLVINYNRTNPDTLKYQRLNLTLQVSPTTSGKELYMLVREELQDPNILLHCGSTVLKPNKTTAEYDLMNQSVLRCTIDRKESWEKFWQNQGWKDDESDENRT